MPYRPSLELSKSFVKTVLEMLEEWERTGLNASWVLLYFDFFSFLSHVCLLIFVLSKLSFDFCWLVQPSCFSHS